ncbi:hypothetical protein HUN08_04685 [Gordonia sp. X0973]|uniref:hypothetical protein n=1 Tax=Gordonia sp. X0973 TaxID=2742602 RepID=UPI000F548511|nr:hypothetical protein [Gordonia sp. X0973]QKT06562.1 hypothetical protein HUN08_04685 [Gordonia sp. X0973]
MKRRLSLAVVSAAAGLSLGAIAIAPASAATPQQAAEHQTASGWRVCIYGPPIGSMSFNFCFP